MPQYLISKAMPIVSFVLLSVGVIEFIKILRSRNHCGCWLNVISFTSIGLAIFSNLSFIGLVEAASLRFCSILAALTFLGFMDFNVRLLSLLNLI
jgi:hypothetical protein